MHAITQSIDPGCLERKRSRIVTVDSPVVFRPARNPLTACSVARSSNATGLADRLVEADRAGADREIGVDSLFEDRLGSRSDRAGQCQHRTVERAREPADADGRLAEGALGVDGPFAGQAQVGILEPLGQLDGGDDQVDAGLELAVGERDESSAQAAGGARAGLILDRHAQVALDDRREVGQVAVERFDHLRAKPLFVGRRRPRLRAGRRGGW